MNTYVALLRGVNLGARNKVSMSELRRLLASLGFEDAVTYLQSGNAVFRTRRTDTRAIAAAIQRAVATEVGVDAAVVLRTPADLRRVVENNPFAADETDATRLLVVFLDRTPRAAATKQLDPGSPGPGRFAVNGREIYVHVPNGFARSKLSLDYFERGLGLTGTMRNWRTVTKLLELAE